MGVAVRGPPSISSSAKASWGLPEKRGLAPALGGPSDGSNNHEHWKLAALAVGCAARHSSKRAPWNRWRSPRDHIVETRLIRRRGGNSEETAVVSETDLWRRIVVFVVPTYALVVTNMILTAIDKGFIGRISSLQLAALGPACAVFDCTSYLLTFLNTATLTMLGSQATPELSKIRSHALSFAVLGGVVQTALLLFSARHAVCLLGARGAMIPFSIAYLQIRALGSTIDRVGSITTQFALAEKDGVTPLLATLIAALVNVVGDFALCRRYGVVGAAVATVAASAVSALFLKVRLGQRKLWPSPIQLPRPGDFKPFAAFAGPVFVVLLMKIVLFSLMTAGATLLGTAPAAAHQVLVSVFFCCGIAFGQPLSWAAQAFLSGLQGAEQSRTRRALLGVSGGFTLLSGVAAWLMTSFCLTWFTRDPKVLLQAQEAAPAVVLIVVTYTLYLSLEGMAIAQKRLRSCLTIAVLSTAVGGLSIWGLSASSSLTLRSLWLSQVVTLAAGALLLGAVALRNRT